MLNYAFQPSAESKSWGAALSGALCSTKQLVQRVNSPHLRNQDKFSFSFSGGDGGEQSGSLQLSLFSSFPQAGTAFPV